MLELTVIRQNTKKVIEGLKKRGFQSSSNLIKQIIKNDDDRKSTQTKADELKSLVKRLSKEIGTAIKSNQIEEANNIKSKVFEIKSKILAFDKKQKNLESKIFNLLIQLPNVPNDKVPNGLLEENNAIYQEWSHALPILPEKALPHWELAKLYNVFDLELGVKVTGAGFPIFIEKGARLQRALINFFLDEAIKAGYKEIVPPILVNEASAFGTGQLPDKEGQMYHATLDDLYLVSTAEIPVTNVARSKIYELKELPIKMTAYSPCFRREAGSYGAHVRGINRVHQFDKVEIVQICEPNKSYETLYQMLKHIESLLIKLELPYRILTLCGGDIGFTSALTYDFEVYSAAQKRWLEVSSVSNLESFQSNRMKIRYKDEKKKTHLTHTLNGSALALARIIASIMENYQTEDGIKVPEVLRPYTGFNIID